MSSSIFLVEVSSVGWIGFVSAFARFASSFAVRSLSAQLENGSSD